MAEPTADERVRLASVLKQPEHTLFDANASIEIRSLR
jgi:hypothetical protein